MARENSDFSSHQTFEYLRALEQRIATLESAIKGDSLANYESTADSFSENDTNAPDGLEIKLGEYWFAYLGVIVLQLGFVFLLALPLSGFPTLLPTLIGITVAVGLGLVARFIADSFKFLSLHLWGAAFLLSYMSGLRLFHFGETTFLDPGLLEYAILLLLCAGMYIIALRRNHAYLLALSLSFLIITGLVINQVPGTLLVNAAAAVLFVIHSQRTAKLSLYIFGSIAVYSAHFIWSLGIPMMGNGAALVPFPGFNLGFLLVYATILSGRLLLPGQDAPNWRVVHANAFANGLIAFLIYIPQTIFYQLDNAFAARLVFFALFSSLALLFWLRHGVNYSMIQFTLMAHGALSFALFSAVDVPLVFIYLIWQSLFVLITAIWFRSKFILVANFLLYLLLFLAYSITAGFSGIISISFGVIGLISARLINWQRVNLHLHTETVRNTYLSIAFVSIPFTLWKSLPPEWVGFTWMGLTLVYYGLSRVLNNGKYRWMGHLTLLATLIYVVIVVTMGQTPAFRIFAFLSLGVVLIVISLFYTRIRQRSRDAALLAESAN